MIPTTLGTSLIAFAITSIAGGAGFGISRLISQRKGGGNVTDSIWKSPLTVWTKPAVSPLFTEEKLAA